MKNHKISSGKMFYESLMIPSQIPAKHLHNNQLAIVVTTLLTTEQSLPKEYCKDRLQELKERHKNKKTILKMIEII